MNPIQRLQSHHWLRLSEAEYRSRLEEATCYTTRATRDADGEPCWFLVDPCGDDCGEPWYEWADLVFETYPELERYEASLLGA